MLAFALQQMKTKYRSGITQEQGYLYMDLAKPQSGALDCNNWSYWKKIEISKKDIVSERVIVQRVVSLYFPVTF